MWPSDLSFYDVLLPYYHTCKEATQKRVIIMTVYIAALLVTIVAERPQTVFLLTIAPTWALV